jgi:CRP-like cAMP-binding protein
MNNRLLNGLSQKDLALLKPHLSAVTLAKEKVLSTPGVRATHCTFLDEGIASLISISGNGHQAEVGLVGWDGLVDVATILTMKVPRLKCFIQLEGHGHQIPVSVLQNAMETSSTLRHNLLAFAYNMLVQISHTAFVNGNVGVEGRLARWLLMYHDRVDGDLLHVTHEFLSLMLGVRRAGVTIALSKLRHAGIISVHRARVTVLDRHRLESAAGEAYGAAETASFG